MDMLANIYWNVKRAINMKGCGSEDPTLKLSANYAVVEGILCFGNGYAQLNEICGAMNMP